MMLGINLSSQAKFEFVYTGEDTYKQEQIWSFENGQAKLKVLGTKSELNSRSVDWFKSLLEYGSEVDLVIVTNDFIRIKNEFELHYLYTKNSLRNFPVKLEFDLHFSEDEIIMSVVSFGTNYPEERLDMFFANEDLIRLKPFKLVRKKLKKTNEYNQMVRIQKIMNDYFLSLKNFL
ncbi:hypothetical protein [uncultured Arcticibacterium sp.]|uniref:hypothetical protein n=1 Tax=uncultured Arcticibacterium sp. TaxID=2173042 RepID=UPI0030FB4D9D